VARAERTDWPSDLFPLSAPIIVATHDSIMLGHGGLLLMERDSVPEDNCGCHCGLERADFFLHDLLTEPVNLTEIAREAGLSRLHLLRLFKSACVRRRCSA
jgi:hypothetical protein